MMLGDEKRARPPHSHPWLLAALLLLARPVVAAEVTLDPKPFQGYEGQTVTRIDLEGFKTTKRYVIERELELQVGEPFHFDTLQADMVRLENLNIFASMVPTPEADGEGVAIHLKLREMPPIIPFLAFTYTEENGFSVGPALSALNFLGRDIQVSGRALFGGTTTYWLKFDYPWIAGDHASVFVYAAHLIRDDEMLGFQETSDEVTPWVGTYLGEHGRLKGAFSYLRMRSDTEGITLTPDDVDELRRLAVAIGWDTRDSWRNPRQGWQNELELWRTGGFLGGDGDFWSMNLDLRRYQPLGDRQTLAIGSLLSLQSGTVGVDVPSYLQYHLGGANSVRGHEIGDLGRRLYGKSQWLNTLEYRYTVLPVRRFDFWKFSFSAGAELAAFTDVGIAWNEAEQFAWNRFAKGTGVGLRLLVPGSEQLRLDVGYSREGGFHFHFGNLSKFTAQRNRLR